MALKYGNAALTAALALGSKSQSADGASTSSEGSNGGGKPPKKDTPSAVLPAARINGKEYSEWVSTGNAAGDAANTSAMIDKTKADVTKYNNDTRKGYNDATKASIMPEYNQNLATNPVDGRLNGKTFKNTLNASRAADRLNNTRWWQPADIGVRHTNGGDRVQQGHGERFEPIETQETRQMRADERIDEQSRMRDVGRKHDVKDYSLEQYKQLDRIDMDLTRQLTVGKAQIDQAWQNYCRQLATGTLNQQAVATFVSELVGETQTRLGTFIYEVAQAYPAFGNMLMQIATGNTTPKLVEMQLDKLWNEVQKDPRFSQYSIETAAGMGTLLAKLMAMQGMDVFNNGVSWTGNINYR